MKQNICSIQGCGKVLRSKGLCHTHYTRQRIHGDPLGGSTFKGEPFRFYKEVALHHEGEDCLIWPHAKNCSGYGQMWVGGKTIIVSSYLCEASYGPRPSQEYQAAHSCGRGHEGCVNRNHLRWATRVENWADKLIHGTHNRGERNSQAKLTEVQAREIVSLRGVETQETIAKRLGICPQAVSAIQRGKWWAWL